MPVEIKVVESKKDLKKFIKMPFKIYEGNTCWVPPLIFDDMDLFNPKKNPAFEVSDVRFFLAYKNGELVGRVAGILNHAANQKYNTKNLRFSWFDTTDDYEVAQALLSAVEAWGKSSGMETMTGPHGFTDLDQEGMLIEGFDQLATIAGFYNHAYYQPLVEKYGFEKEIDYVEFRSVVPQETGVPEKLLRLGEKIKERSGIRVVNFSNRRELMKRAPEIFELLDESFEEIYGSVPLTRNQIMYYVNKYISFVDKDLVKLAVDENNEAIGFMITMPSLSRAFQKARGRLLPFGWYYILKAMKKGQVIDFLLAGVKKKYRGLGVDLLMVLEIVQKAMEKGYLYSESNPELEDNKKVHGQWKYFNPTQHKRRRIFRKNIA